jgi:hypothetical protein
MTACDVATAERQRYRQRYRLRLIGDVTKHLIAVETRDL